MSPLREPRKTCSIEGCDRPHKARVYCAAHYKRFLIYGDPRPDIPIRRSEGKRHIHHGYKIVSIPPDLRRLSDGKTKLAEHRLVMARHLGRSLAADENVHHVNGIRTDNRLENLELWSTSQPSGKRVLDLIEFALVILDRYWEESPRLSLERP